MTVSEIIKAVRWCIDEESNDVNLDSDDKDDVYMDNIIRAKISDALRWACTNAPGVMLSGSDNDLSSGLLKDYTFTLNGEHYNGTWDKEHNIGCISMPDADNFIRVLRIRGSGWHRAIITPEEEDSEKSLQMFDNTAEGTVERPIAVIVRQNCVKFLVQPASEKVEITVVVSPSSVSESDASDTNVVVPENIKGGFLYYLAYLLLSAYDDTKASAMYNIATQQLGITEKSK